MSNLDRTLRIDGVRRNLFVQRQVALPGETAVAGFDNSTLFDTARLKSGDQMMASEGVVATVFFRWLAPGPTENVAERDAHGPYDSLESLYKRVPMPKAASTAITGLNAAALEAGTNTRR